MLREVGLLPGEDVLLLLHSGWGGAGHTPYVGDQMMGAQRNAMGRA